MHCRNRSPRRDSPARAKARSMPPVAQPQSKILVLLATIMELGKDRLAFLDLLGCVCSRVQRGSRIQGAEVIAIKSGEVLVGVIRIGADHPGLAGENRPQRKAVAIDLGQQEVVAPSETARQPTGGGPSRPACAPAPRCARPAYRPGHTVPATARERRAARARVSRRPAANRPRPHAAAIAAR